MCLKLLINQTGANEPKQWITLGNNEISRLNAGVKRPTVTLQFASIPFPTVINKLLFLYRIKRCRYPCEILILFFCSNLLFCVLLRIIIRIFNSIYYFRFSHCADDKAEHSWCWRALDWRRTAMGRCRRSPSEAILSSYMCCTLLRTWVWSALQAKRRRVRTLHLFPFWRNRMQDWMDRRLLLET